MLRNMVCNLFVAPSGDERPRRITTTIPKAKEARRVAERAITLGKRGTLHARRRAIALLGSKRVVKALFEEIAPLYTDRQGGYTRIVRLAKARVGDATPLCYLELVAEPLEAAPRATEPVAPRVVSAPEGQMAAEENAGPEGGEAPDASSEAAEDHGGGEAEVPDGKAEDTAS